MLRNISFFPDSEDLYIHSSRDSCTPVGAVGKIWHQFL